MKEWFFKLISLLVIAFALYQLPACIDGSIAFQDAVVANHLEANKRAE